MINQTKRKIMNKEVSENNEINKNRMTKEYKRLVADTFCITSPKRYFGNVKISDGHRLNKDKLKITGVSMISKTNN